MVENKSLWITPSWPAPPRVKSLTTLRTGGVSLPPYDSFNLAAHVGDDPKSVLKNRIQLLQKAKLTTDPFWLTQVHGTTVLELDEISDETKESKTSFEPPEADAAISRTKGKIPAVLTADCLPILICNNQGSEVAAIHAGWRGLAKGIIEITVEKLFSKRETLMAWLGPAIGPTAFEVGEEMRDAFSKKGDESAFKTIAYQTAKWTADIYQLARLRLQSLNIDQIYGGNFCTFTEPQRFFSFRRSNPTGRMATLIWLD